MTYILIISINHNFIELNKYPESISKQEILVIENLEIHKDSYIFEFYENIPVIENISYKRIYHYEYDENDKNYFELDKENIKAINCVELS